LSETSDIAVFVNLRSGRGRGARVAAALRGVFEGAGYRVRELTIDRLGEIADVATVDCRCLVAVVGDGTVHAALPHLIESGLPVYHAPLGTENLFSREFGMSCDPASVLRAIEAGKTRRVDLGSCDGKPFAVMCGLGFDANVIEALHNVRKGSISHLSYLRPVVREIVRLRRVPVSVEVDGNLVVDRACGQLVIANSRQYALRNDPAYRASMTDGETDVVFLPHTTRLGLFAWSLRMRTRTHTSSPRAVYERGKVIRVTAHRDGAAVQIDGEFVTSLAEGQTIEITTLASALNVLEPA